MVIATVAPTSVVVPGELTVSVEVTGTAGVPASYCKVLDSMFASTGGLLAWLTLIVRCAGPVLVAPTESVTVKETVLSAGLAELSEVKNSTERSAAW